MNIPKEAIERAIEGGWEHGTADVIKYFLERGDTEHIRWQHIALDPTFWQSLGKALGWPKNHLFDRAAITWSEYALHFAELILTGQDTTAFWKELLQD